MDRAFADGEVINASDMLVIPDPSTAWIDIFNAEPTLSFICTIKDPITREPYDRDPRGVAEKAEAYLKAPVWLIPPFLGQRRNSLFSMMFGTSTAPTAPFTALTARKVSGTQPAKSFQTWATRFVTKKAISRFHQRIRCRISETRCALKWSRRECPIERQHHEVGTAGQAEIDIRFAPLKVMGDHMMYYKYITKNVAKKYNKVVTFMPKPLFGDNGSGMHTHQSLWKDGKPLFAGDKYAGLSEMALFYIGGY